MRNFSKVVRVAWQLLCIGLLVSATAPALAQNSQRVWSVSGSGDRIAATDCTDCGDNIGIVLACTGATTPPQVRVNWSAVANGSEGSSAPITFHIDGRSYQYVARARFYGQIGYVPEFSLSRPDQLLPALIAGRRMSVDYARHNTAFSMIGARAALNSFEADCPWFAGQAGTGGPSLGPAQQASNNDALGWLGASPAANPPTNGQSPYGAPPAAPQTGFAAPTSGQSGQQPYASYGAGQGAATPAITDPNARWMVASGAGTTGVRLYFGVPGSANIAFFAECSAENPAAGIGVDINADVGNLGNGDLTSVLVSGGGGTATYPGTVSISASIQATSVQFSVGANDPLWQMLASGGELDVAVPGGPAVSLPLAGAAQQAQTFLSGCQTQLAGSGQQPGTMQAPYAASPPPTDVVSPTIVGVGKWAEGLAFDGRWLWAAESGQRTIAKIDIDRAEVLRHVKVGRLPVSMVSFGNRRVYGLVETDKSIWREKANGTGRIIAHLPGCPQGMVGDAPYLWVLTWPGCSSGQSEVVRVDLQASRQSTSAALGQWGQALTTWNGQVWVGHARDGVVNVIDEATMQTSQVRANGASLWSMTANSQDVFGGGRAGQDNNQGLVVMFDPRTQSEVHRISLPARVAQITSDERHVVAVGEHGTIWVLSAADLSLERTIKLNVGTFDPRGVVLLGRELMVSAQTYGGSKNGAVFLVQDAIPGTP